MSKYIATNKVACSQCGKPNSKFIRWCLHCAAYCYEDDASKTVDDIFSSTLAPKVVTSKQQSHEYRNTTASGGNGGNSSVFDYCPHPPTHGRASSREKSSKRSFVGEEEKEEEEESLLDNGRSYYYDLPMKNDDQFLSAKRRERSQKLLQKTAFFDNDEEESFACVAPPNYSTNASFWHQDEGKEKNGAMEEVDFDDHWFNNSHYDEFSRGPEEEEVEQVVENDYSRKRNGGVDNLDCAAEEEEKEKRADGKQSFPDPFASAGNPYFTNKREIEDLITRSSVWLKQNDGCYQSTTLLDDDVDVSVEDIEPVEDVVEVDQPVGCLDLSHVVDQQTAGDYYRQLSSRLTDYSQFLQMTPRICVGEASLLLSLPPELLCYLLSLLAQPDLVALMQVCQKLRRFAADPQFWRNVVVQHKSLADDWLLTIARRRPRTLSLVCCDGACLSSSALADLFRSSDNSLTAFTLRASSRGALDADNVVLRMAGPCGGGLVRLDMSWSSLTDVGLGIVAASFLSLRHLNLSGCQALTDGPFCELLAKLGSQLTSLILCQNANLGQASFSAIGQTASSLQHLELNSFSGLTDAGVAQCLAGLDGLKQLGLEHCKRLTDEAVVAVGQASFASSLELLNLAKNRRMTQRCLAVIAARLPRLRSLIVSRLPGVTDGDLSAFATAGAPWSHLQALDLGGLSSITADGVLALLAACPSLIALNLLGCSKISKTRFKNDTRFVAVSPRIAVVI